MSTSDFSLIPADDPQSAAPDDLAAATAGALALPDVLTPAPPPPAAPLGISWRFDWQAGQFARVGQSPAQVSGTDALAERCLMAIHSARYAHPVFTDQFGMEEPDSVLGEFAEGEALADWQRALVDALMAVDGVSAVQSIVLDWDPTTGVLTVLSLDVITGEDEAVTVSDVTLKAGNA